MHNGQRTEGDQIISFLSTLCSGELKIDLSIKKSSGEPRDIFFSNFTGPMSPMLQNKRQAHWSFGSGEDV